MLVGIINYLTQSPKLVFLNVNQGDSMLYTHKNFQILIDAGPGDYTVQNLGKYMSFWDKEIEYLVITHYHYDHYGGLIDIFSEFQIQNIVLTSSLCKKSLEYLKLEELVQEENAKIYTSLNMKQNELLLKVYSIGENKCVTSQKEVNNSSLISEIIVNDIKILNMGDLEKDVENKIKIRDVHILKAGHHCSNTSSSGNFIKQINPKVVICSVGQNFYGHPSKDVLDLFNKNNIEYFKTIDEGNIVVNLKRKVIYNQDNKIIYKL